MPVLQLFQTGRQSGPSEERPAFRKEVGCACAGFFVYLVSRWAPEQKQSFYAVHNFLGAATLIWALVSACIGWGAEQIYVMAVSGPKMEWFYCEEAYTAALMLIPVFGILLCALGLLVVLAFTVYAEQAIPAAPPATSLQRDVKIPV